MYDKINLHYFWFTKVDSSKPLNLDNITPVYDGLTTDGLKRPLEFLNKAVNKISEFHTEVHEQTIKKNGLFLMVVHADGLESVDLDKINLKKLIKTSEFCGKYLI